MKNLILLATTSMVLFALSSCQKDKAVVPSNPTAVNRAANTTKTRPVTVIGAGQHRIFYDHGGTAFGCAYIGGNCLDDIVIIAPKVSQLMSLIVGEGDYAGFISRNMEDLSADIPGDYLQGVVDQEYTLSIKSNDETKMDYMIFQDDDKEIVLVIPFQNK